MLFQKLLEIGDNGEDGVPVHYLVMEESRKEYEFVMILLLKMEAQPVMEMIFSL